jgi:hypothetical protein
MFSIPQKQVVDYTQTTCSLVSGDSLGGEIVVYKPSQPIWKTPANVPGKLHKLVLSAQFQSNFSAFSDAFQTLFSAVSVAGQHLYATVSPRAQVLKTVFFVGDARQAHHCRVLPVCHLCLTCLAPVSGSYAGDDPGTIARKNAGTFGSALPLKGRYACEKGGEL